METSTLLNRRVSKTSEMKVQTWESSITTCTLYCTSFVWMMYTECPKFCCDTSEQGTAYQELLYVMSTAISLMNGKYCPVGQGYWLFSCKIQHSWINPTQRNQWLLDSEIWLEKQHQQSSKQGNREQILQHHNADMHLVWYCCTLLKPRAFSYLQSRHLTRQEGAQYFQIPLSTDCSPASSVICEKVQPKLPWT